MSELTKLVRNWAHDFEHDGELMKALPLRTLADSHDHLEARVRELEERLRMLAGVLEYYAPRDWGGNMPPRATTALSVARAVLEKKS